MSGRRDRLTASLTALAGALLTAWMLRPLPPVEVPPEAGPLSFSGDSLRCVIALQDAPADKGMLSALGYAMLRQWAADDQFTAHIRFARSDEGYLDSLRNGRCEVVLRLRDSLSMEGLLDSRMTGDSLVWTLSERHASRMDSLNRWISAFCDDPAYPAWRRKFHAISHPERALERGLRVQQLSPYDDLIRQYARELSWDWRLLASVIYNESHFELDAESRRGAFGLMQVLPSPQRSKEELIDPEDNIRAGVRYLKRLQRFMERYELSEEEQTRFVVAAYNAGEGRIQDCIQFARSLQIDSLSWERISAMIPLMNEDSILDQEEIRHGKFHGGETLRYVENVFSVYAIYQEICR